MAQALPIVEVSGLSKSVPNKIILRNISFSVFAGEIVGFLGPNGAGKTTVLKCILGLVKPTAGSCTVFGKSYLELEDTRGLVGSALDPLAFYLGRTALRTLQIVAAAHGLDGSRVYEVAEACGLMHNELNLRLKNYSLGMKQRLCVAVSILANPRLLILDEPINGLDPEGISWIRGFLRSFADRGGTVLVSSHIITEVSKIADRVIMIGSGRIVEEVNLATAKMTSEELEELYFARTAHVSRGGGSF